MGLNGSHSYTHSISGVSIGELYQIALFRKKSTSDSNHNNDNNQLFPTIDIDVSWVYRSSSCHIDTRVNWLINLGLEFAKTGFIVAFICDGSKRHSSKRATVARNAKSNKIVNEAFIKRAELMQLAEQRKETNSVEELKLINDKEIILSNKALSLEKSVVVDVGEKLFLNIKDAIDEIDYNKIGVRKAHFFVVLAQFQADSVLAFRCINRISDIVLCSDSDLAALCGSHCVAIKKFKYLDKGKGDKLSLIDLYTPSFNTLINVCGSIFLPMNSTRIKKSKFPIFENINNIKIRGLLAVGLGCDVFISGIYKLGKSSLKKFMEKEDNLSYDKLLDYYYQLTLKKIKKKINNSDLLLLLENDIDNNKYDNNTIYENNDYYNVLNREQFNDAVNTYVDAFIYEPSNYFFDEVQNEKAIYITNNKPNKLHKYLEDFTNNDDDIEIYTSTNTIIECIGSGSGSHQVLCFEKHYTCMSCDSTICKYCTNSKNENKYCHKCYLTEVAVVPKNIISQPTINIMRSELSAVGIETTADDNVGDLSDIYEAVIEQKKYEFYTPSSDFIKSISLPLYSSDYLNNEKIISSRFDLKNGGAFIRDTDLTLINKVDLICLFGKMVQVGNEEYKKTNNKVMTILPDLIVSFAERSRVHTGYRLLKRALRHAMDPDGSSILNSSCCIIIHNNKTGMHITHKVKASMKNQTYDVGISFTSTDIVAVTCTCKAGSVGKEKIMCVHILPVIFQFTLLLFDGLAEHLLCELANELEDDLESILGIENSRNLKDSILLLRRATGEIENENLLEHLSIKDILMKYNVGTELYKRGPGPPIKKNLGPLRNLDFQSPALMAENLMKKKSTNKISNTEQLILNDESTNNNIIPYKLINDLIVFIKQTFKHHSKSNTTLNECIGHKLITLRCNNEDEDFISKKEMNKIKTKMLEAFNEANQEYRKPSNVMNNQDLPSENISTYNNFEKQSSSSDDDDSNISNDSNTNLNNCENINNINDTTNKNFTSNKNTKLTSTCCVPGCIIPVSKRNHIKFTRVPPTPVNKLNEKSSNNMIQTYHRKMFLRRVWLRRLCLPTNHPNQRLLTCSQHNLEIDKLEYKWKNNENENILTISEMKVPVSKNEPPIKTRNQRNKRKEYINQPQPSKRQKSLTTNESLIVVNDKHKTRRYCCYVNCCVNDSYVDDNVKFYKVPKHPPPLKQNSNNLQRKNHGKKIIFRKLYCKAIGISFQDIRKDLRICNRHKIQRVNHMLVWFDKNKNKQSTKISIDLPAVASELLNENQHKRQSKGLGIDRLICNTINNAKEAMNLPGREDLAWAMTVQQTYALTDGTEDVHPSVAKACGLAVHEPLKFQYKVISNKKEKEKTMIRLDNINDTMIKALTGFESKIALLSFIIIICNADIEIMKQKTSKLTWFEEWFFYFEKTYSRGASRWFDSETRYQKSHQVLRNIFDNKHKLALLCRKKWPHYVSLQEDEILRKESWNNTYRGQRVVMWDNTAIRLPKPQESEAQRNTWSAYYAGNVGKGAIFIQLCGWMGTHELWMGAVTDSDYFTDSGILAQQVSYVTTYDASNMHVPWVNILDKGYRVTTAAWRNGKQFILQPSFAKADTKFSTIETLRSAAIARDRGANERAVRLSKMSGQLKEGRTGNKSIERLSDIWLTWSFQCNFIYKPVL